MISLSSVRHIDIIIVDRLVHQIITVMINIYHSVRDELLWYSQKLSFKTKVIANQSIKQVFVPDISEQLKLNLQRSLIYTSENIPFH